MFDSSFLLLFFFFQVLVWLPRTSLADLKAKGGQILLVLAYILVRDIKQNKISPTGK